MYQIQINIKLGSKVHHPKFGTGTVVALKGPDVTIAFDNQGIKTINKEYYYQQI